MGNTISSAAQQVSKQIEQQTLVYTFGILSAFKACKYIYEKYVQPDRIVYNENGKPQIVETTAKNSSLFVLFLRSLVIGAFMTADQFGRVYVATKAVEKLQFLPEFKDDRYYSGSPIIVDFVMRKVLFYSEMAFLTYLKQKFESPSPASLSALSSSASPLSPTPSASGRISPKPNSVHGRQLSNLSSASQNETNASNIANLDSISDRGDIDSLDEVSDEMNKQTSSPMLSYMVELTGYEKLRKKPLKVLTLWSLADFAYGATWVMLPPHLRYLARGLIHSTAMDATYNA